jgi:hypothetical protein
VISHNRAVGVVLSSKLISYEIGQKDRNKQIDQT